MKILIVEDDPGMATVFRTKLGVLLDKFPAAEITVVRSFREARAKTHLFPFPDCIILDLTLIDYTWEETLRDTDELESRSPVIVVTGHPEEKVKALLTNPDIEIIPKTPESFSGSFLIAAIARAINRRAERENIRIKDNLATMRDLLNQRDSYASPSQ